MVRKKSYNLLNVNESTVNAKVYTTNSQYWYSLIKRLIPVPRLTYGKFWIYDIISEVRIQLRQTNLRLIYNLFDVQL